jgi:hypothetical protein
MSPTRQRDKVKGGTTKMEAPEISQAQWQFLWNQRANTSRTEAGNEAVSDWLFELITEHGYDVRSDVVVDLRK